MFRIPSFYRENFEFDEAVEIMKRRGEGDLLEGLKSMDRIWEMHCANQHAFYKGEIDEMVYGDDEDFFDHWIYEVNAYNVVVEKMRPLFV